VSRGSLRGEWCGGLRISRQETLVLEKSYTVRGTFVEELSRQNLSELVGQKEGWHVQREVAIVLEGSSMHPTT